MLGDTGEKEALLAVEKLRRLLMEVHFPGKDKAVEFSAGLAQAVMRQHFDPVDIVTEVANRADHALELAIAQGDGTSRESGAAVRGIGGRGVELV